MNKIFKSKDGSIGLSADRNISSMCLSHMVENQLRNHCNFCMRGVHKGSQ
jgi:hypothetical protein